VSKRNWLNGFAFGVVAGFLLTPALIFAAIIFGVSPGDFSQPQNQSNGGEQVGPKDDRWWLIRRVVYMDDTAAQWVMMFATIFAAYLLLRTLWATQQMVADTRDIGETQVRAYLKAKIGNVIQERLGDNPRGNLKVAINLKVVNVGQTPATAYTVYYFIGDTGIGDRGTLRLDTDGANSGETHSFIASGDESNVTVYRVWYVADRENLIARDGRYLRFAYSIRYTDIFGKTHETPINSGTFRNNPDGEAAFVSDYVIDPTEIEKAQ
jgi:hypothetical protein